MAILIALLLIVWWIGVWGLVDTLVQQIIKNSVQKAILVYSSLIGFVLLIVWMNPTLLEHFV